MHSARFSSSIFRRTLMMSPPTQWVTYSSAATVLDPIHAPSCSLRIWMKFRSSCGTSPRKASSTSSRLAVSIRVFSMHSASGFTGVSVFSVPSEPNRLTLPRPKNAQKLSRWKTCSLTQGEAQRRSTLLFELAIRLRSSANWLNWEHSTQAKRSMTASACTSWPKHSNAMHRARTQSSPLRQCRKKSAFAAQRLQHSA